VLKLGWRENITVLFEPQPLEMNRLLNFRGHGSVPLQIRLPTFIKWLDCSNIPVFYGTRKVFFLHWHFKNIDLTEILRTFVPNDYTSFRTGLYVEESGFLKGPRALDLPAIFLKQNICLWGKCG